MNVTIVPKTVLSGEIVAPSSKAHTHRALFAGLLSNGVTRIERPLSCDDTQATARAVSTLGAKLVMQPETWTVEGNGIPQPLGDEIQCGESGVTLRFTIPIAALTAARVTLTGSEALMRRPLEPLADAMKQLGVRVTVERDKIQVDGGPPKEANVHIRGDISSQFISGLLLAGPLMEDGLNMRLRSPLESRDYVSLTIEIMKRHGIQVENDSEMSHFEVAPGQKYVPAEHQIPGDFSSAAFAMSAAAITKSKVLIMGLPKRDAEPDAVLLDFLSQMGAKTALSDGSVSVEGGRLRAVSIDLRDNPDLGPIIAVLGSYAEGETKITGAARLRFKESDRLSAIASELNALGAQIVETNDGLVVHGPTPLSGGLVRSHGDHRIAMALSVAALGAREKVVIEEAECVSKSYPNFFDDLRSLGVEVVE
jgi:3-phosphoshikimate 1-carboxyvinyltransferase